IDGVAHAECCIFANFGRIGSRARRENGMIKGFRRNHRASHTVLFERALDLRNYFGLLVRTQFGGGNHVAVVRAPIRDADLAELSDDVFESDWLPSRGVKQRLTLVRRRPLRSADEVLAACFRAVSASAHFRESFDERSLLIRWYWLHGE